MNSELRQRLYAEATELAARHPADLESAVARGHERLRNRATLLSVLTAVAVLAAAAALVIVRLVGPAGGDASRSATVIGIVVSAPGQQLPPGLKIQASAKATLSDGRTRQLEDGVVWSSANPSVVAVDGAGLLTAVAEGSTAVSATFGGFTSSLTFSVVPGSTFTPTPSVTVRALQIDPESTSVRAGLTTAFSAQLRLSDNSVIPASQLTWKTSDEKIATVDAAGTVTGVAPGSALLTATAKDPLGASYEALALVVVTPPEVVRVQVAPATVPPLFVGDRPVKLTATVTYTTGKSEVVDAVAWSSENGEAVRMDDHGNAYPEKAGTSRVTAMYQGTTSQPVTITVKQID
ncbi:Ig-like domain-containing protein [Sinomonas flava]|uniref:BIG2 domain-containing protein n=1 Tax=Sinomonas flava TaxID=496857 RepID=A0ABP5NKR1_9MICC